MGHKAEDINQTRNTGLLTNIHSHKLEKFNNNKKKKNKSKQPLLITVYYLCIFLFILPVHNSLQKIKEKNVYNAIVDS